MRTDLFAIALAMFVALLVAITLRYSVRARRSSGDSWQSLLDRLVRIDRAKIALIASDLVDASGSLKGLTQDSPLEPSQIWELIGGLHGLEVLEANCAVLIDLACYVQRWYPEALVIAEQLRLDARAIQWNLGRLKGAAEAGNLQSAFPEYAQRAVATYYLMTRNLLALYEAGNLPGLPELQTAI